MQSEDHKFVFKSLLQRQDLLRNNYRLRGPPTRFYSSLGASTTKSIPAFTFRYRLGSTRVCFESCGTVVSKFSRFPAHLARVNEKGVLGLAHSVCTLARGILYTYAYLICFSRLQSAMPALSHSSPLQDLRRIYSAL